MIYEALVGAVILIFEIGVLQLYTTFLSEYDTWTMTVQFYISNCKLYKEKRHGR